MANDRMEHRGVPLRMLTTSGWMSGRLHLPAKAILQDFLDHAGPFLSLTEVHFGIHTDLPFLALQRAAVAVVVSPLGEPEGTEQESSPHRVSMLLGHHVVRGQLRTLPGVRVSDYLLHHRGFVRVEDAQVHEQGSDKAQAFPALYVNCDRMVGVAELEPVRA